MDMYYIRQELAIQAPKYPLGRLKLIVCFASTPSDNFQELSEKNTHLFSFKILQFH